MRDNNPFYSQKLIWKYLLILIGVAVVMKFTGGAGFAVIVPFAFMSLLRNQPDELFFYLFVAIAMVVVNGALIPKNAFFFMEQRAMMVMLGFSLLLKISGQRKVPYIAPFMNLMAYIVYMVFPSTSGWCPFISYAKLFLFAVIFLAYYGAANMAATQPRDFSRSFRSMALSICIFFIVGSLLLIPFPGYSQMTGEDYLYTGESLFRGMTSHCNCFGPMVSGMAALLYSDMIFGVKKYDKLYVVLLLCCPLLIWKTSSRTAMATMMSGFAFATFFFSLTRNVSGSWKGKIMSLANISVCLLCMFVLILPSAREKATRFIMKRDYEKNLAMTTENIFSSRMGLMTQGLDNFKKKPVFGNGFQVVPQMEDLSKTVEWYHLLSAPIEKGVWTTAILEEGGVIGMSLFVIFLLTTISYLLRYKAYCGATTLFVFVVSNFGEFSFFSMSLLGGFMWTLVFASLVMDAARLRRGNFVNMRGINCNGVPCNYAHNYHIGCQANGKFS